VPEIPIDMDAEATRLRGVMDDLGCVNLFLSEGAGVPEIVAQLEAAGEEVPRDPFGHVKLDRVNPGEWFAKQFASRIGAEKTMVQKSGYFSRSAPANEADRTLIRQMVDVAVESARAGVSGVVGQDEEREDELRTIEFDRIAGGKAFDISVDWFQTVLKRTGEA
jgi:diphosphate-dependent phosphofructokinase